MAKPSGLQVLPGGGVFCQRTVLGLLQAYHSSIHGVKYPKTGIPAPLHRLGRGTSGAAWIAACCCIHDCLCCCLGPLHLMSTLARCLRPLTLNLLQNGAQVYCCVHALQMHGVGSRKTSPTAAVVEAAAAAAVTMPFRHRMCLVLSSMPEPHPLRSQALCCSARL